MKLQSHYAGLLALLLCASAVGAAAADIRFGLVSYWPLDVDNGGTTPDLSFSNQLVITGGCAVVPGRYSNAFYFDGISQYASVVHDTDNSGNGLPIYSAAGGYTVALWVKGAPDQADKYVFAESSTNGGNPLFLLETKNGMTKGSGDKLDILLRSSANALLLNHVLSSATVFDNTWHHVAWVDDHGSARLYVDGKLDDTSFNYAYAPGSVVMNVTSIGALVRKNVIGFFQGAIDSVAVWERVLSPAEVQSVMTNGIPTPIPPTLPGVPPSPPAETTNALNGTMKFPPPRLARGLAPIAKRQRPPTS